jgi:hypothetical protein
VPVFQDLEKCHTAEDFAMAVYREVHQFLSGKGKAARRAAEWFRAIGGLEVGGLFKLPDRPGAHWKDVLTRSIEDLILENNATGTRLLFLWDEVPFMLANIRDREGEQRAMEVLDTLRALRQTHSGLRMIITGSIGLHHVFASLKEKNYANSPVNDMAAIDVPPLEERDAQELACQLIQGEKLQAPDLSAAAIAIAQEADCFPFYIHQIVRALKIAGRAATPASVHDIVAAQLVDANDPWELLHYRQRVRTYYGPDEKTVLLILDHLACPPGPGRMGGEVGAASLPLDLSQTQLVASVNELLSALKGASHFDDRERLLQLLSWMERDHYLFREPDGQYRFRFPLLRRWWKINRGL